MVRRPSAVDRYERGEGEREGVILILYQDTQSEGGVEPNVAWVDIMGKEKPTLRPDGMKVLVAASARLRYDHASEGRAAGQGGLAAAHCGP